MSVILSIIVYSTSFLLHSKCHRILRYVSWCCGRTGQIFQLSINNSALNLEGLHWPQIWSINEINIFLVLKLYCVTLMTDHCTSSNVCHSGETDRADAKARGQASRLSSGVTSPQSVGCSGWDGSTSIGETKRSHGDSVAAGNGNGGVYTSSETTLPFKFCSLLKIIEQLSSMWHVSM